mgnify:FL=1
MSDKELNKKIGIIICQYAVVKKQQNKALKEAIKKIKLLFN